MNPNAGKRVEANEVPDRGSPAVRELLERARVALTDASSCPALEAEVLLAAALGCGRSHLYAWPDWLPTSAEVARFFKWLEQRRAGQPVAYLLGQREFWGLNLAVSRATLIPRPETERLVELALEHIDRGRAADIADLGTGSGAVALALARERPLARIAASDVSAAALEVARQNARRLGIANVRFHRGDWFSGFPKQRRFDVAVSNPPYVAENDPALDALRYEPRTALVAGGDGLNAIRRIVAEAPHWLGGDGWLLVEHGADQGLRVARLLKRWGYRDVVTERDLGGLDRVSLGRRPSRELLRGSR